MKEGDVPAALANAPLFCACGQERRKDHDPPLHVHDGTGPGLQGPDGRWLRSCRWCGAVYVVPLRFRS